MTQPQRSIIAFTKDWGDVPTCTTHLLRLYAESAPVLWVSSIGTRRPSLASGKDLGRIWGRLARFWSRAEHKENQLRVLSPLLLPRVEAAWATALNRVLFRHYVRRERRWLGSAEESCDYWCFVPNAVDLLPGGRGRGVDSCSLSPREARGEVAGGRADNQQPVTNNSPTPRIVYYCADDWTQFHNLDGAWMGRKEAELVARADVIFVTSRILFEKFRDLYPECVERLHQVSHGVDYARFSAARELPAPADVASLARPIIGFYGNLHPWVDMALIERLAEARPSWTFLLIGQAYTELGALEELGNVHMMGRREHAELPGYCGQFDVAMIPYDMDQPRMASVNPVKTKELLAAGVPIVASMVPELEGYGDRVRCCASDEEWLAALEEQASRTDREAISESVRGEDWRCKLVDVVEVLERGEGERRVTGNRRRAGGAGRV